MRNLSNSELTASEEALYWGIKQSFREYIVAAAGEITLTSPAVLRGDMICFPMDSVQSHVDSTNTNLFSFRGGVRFQAHHGLLDVSICDPWIELSSTGLRLTVAGRGGTERIELASLTAVGTSELDEQHLRHDVATRLSAEGESVFECKYPPGTELDPLVYIVHRSHSLAAPETPAPVSTQEQ